MWDRDDQMNLHGTSKAHASGRGRNGLERTLFDPVLVSDVWCWSSLDNFHPCFLHHLRWLMNFSIAPKNFHEKKHKSFSGPRLPSRITRGTSSFFLFLSFSGIATDTATEPVATAAAALGPAAAAAAAAATAGAALGQALFALLVHLGDASLPLGDAPSTLFFLLSNLKQSKLKKKKNTTKLYPFFHQFAAQISNGGYWQFIAMDCWRKDASCPWPHLPRFGLEAASEFDIIRGHQPFNRIMWIQNTTNVQKLQQR